MATFQVFPRIFFYFQFLPWFFLVKAVFEDNKCGVNVKCNALCGLHGMMDTFSYFSYWLFSYILCSSFLGMLFFKRTLRFHTEMWVEFGCYYKCDVTFHCWELNSKTLYLELNEIKLTLRNLTLKYYLIYSSCLQLM